MKNCKRMSVGAIMLSGLLIMTFSSCTLIRKISPPPKKLVETSSIKNYQAPDVPVPANFELQTSKSYAYITSIVRTVGLNYIGSARTEDLLDFYRRQMPQSDWRERMTLSIDSKQAIAFQKNYERCEIIITQKSSGETYLLIKIDYKP
ncbi:MAG: hypothetical protein QME51_04435 [Planctomycetota bacterium]|nr:hypothetical protein [Planctomycetota bacterium]